MSEARTTQTRARPWQPVLVGYDGSTAGGRALAWAAGLARRIHQPLLVAYISAPPAPYAASMADPADQEAALLDWLRTEMAESLPPTALTGVETHVVSRAGDIGYELGRLADEHHAEALVLGAPEHKVHQLFGSVSTRLARHAHCPVVVVP